jgi:nucleoside-diphosphate-sugar epimerase
MEKILVTGAGGFIGHHMVSLLKKKGFWVRGVDIKKAEYEKTAADEFLILDLRDFNNAEKSVSGGITEVYNFAANMGGIGFIETVHAEVLRDNVLINANMLEASRFAKVSRFFFSSSACIYPRYKQKGEKNAGLAESDAYPADPDNEYGWEKLFTERMCKAYYEDYGLETRVARFHNIYGPLGTWQGGREKSPAAICRKVALAGKKDTIEVWGDGKQGRSYCFIDDCVEGVFRLMHSEFRKPLNIGSDRLVSINEMIDMVAGIAGKKIAKQYDKTKPQGVRGRNSDNTLIKKVLKWSPPTRLEEGLKKTYLWILGQIESGKYIKSKQSAKGDFCERPLIKR